MLTRRRFLYHGCAASAATMTAGATVLQLAGARRAAAQAAGGYRALVCILLAGGNDSFNMLIPDDSESYAGYADLRTDLALPRESALPLPGSDALGRRYALHPGMPELQQRFARGEAAFVNNVGTLLAPVDFNAIASGSWPRPLGLFSHADQIEQWQTAVSDARIAEGWGGRLADLFPDAGSANGIAMNISLSGNNVFQGGASVAPYAVTTDDAGAVALAGYDDDTPGGDFTRAVVDQLLAAPQAALLRRAYRNTLAGAIEAQQSFSAALAGAPPLATPFADDAFSLALRQVARIVSIRETLGASRQTFFITVGGWDHHDDVLENQAAMLPMIDTGLGAFRNALLELGVFDRVTTFTTSDFGRTLTSNGKGSDHGWGGHQLVMGGAVNGGAFYGEYPDIYPGNPLDVGRGSFVPTLSVDQYFAELALWFGVAPGDLATVLPNIGTFYSPASGMAPVGFLA
jgi:uncharacterized protein (DUF1501 family)